MIHSFNFFLLSLLLIKCFLLQNCFKIKSDPELENLICDRLSFRDFLKLPVDYPFPDYSTFSRFRKHLSKDPNPPPIFDCSRVGKGITALKYLSRYLYRGVISENNIVSNHNGRVTFRYVESSTGKTRYRTLNGEDFLFLIIQHVLPKGFRRFRDFGFLHGNAKKLLALVQLVLRVIITDTHQRSRPVFKCPCCKKAMIF